MNVTGIPPHIGIMRELKSLTEALKVLPNSMTETLGDFVEQRSLSSRPVTKDEVKTVTLEVLENFWQRVNAHEDAGSGQDESHRQEDASDFFSEFVSPKEQPLFPCNGKLSRLPPDFTLPSGNLHTAWMCFLFSDKEKGTPPLRAVFGREMSRKFGPSFSRYKQLMQAIVDQASRQGIWKEPNTPNEALTILDQVDLSDIVSTETAKKRG